MAQEEKEEAEEKEKKDAEMEERMAEQRRNDQIKHHQQLFEEVMNQSNIQLVQLDKEDPERNSVADIVGSATAVPNNPAGTATPIPIAVNVAIAAGQTAAFYITFSTGTGMNYTDGTAVGNVYSSDANISVKEGTGKAYPFGSDYHPRIFNGIVNYSAGGGCGASTRTPVRVDLRETQLASVNTTTTTDFTCIVNESGVDWTYYYNSSSPDDLLFAIAKDPAGLGNNTFNANVEITVANNPTTTGFWMQEDLSLPAAHWVMGRYWNVNITSGALVDPVWVRFYYDPAEKARILTEATAWQAVNGGVVGSFKHFKTVNSNFLPATDLFHSGIYNSLELVNNTDNLTAANGTNYVEYTGVTSFSGGSITLGTSSTLLNVGLENFDVSKVDNRKALLEWTISEEEGVQSYEVLRSSNAYDFEKRGDVPALNNGSINIEFSFVDENPSQGMNYYRLKILKNDGTFDLSTVKVLDFDDNVSDFIVQPNPFSDEFYIEFNGEQEAKAEVVIYNSMGSMIVNRSFDSVVGHNRFLVDGNEKLVPGTYYLQFRSEGIAFYRKIVRK